MTEQDDFDVVVDALKARREALWKMTRSNLQADMFGGLDQIRLEQIDQLDAAIGAWRKTMAHHRQWMDSLEKACVTNDMYTVGKVHTAMLAFWNEHRKTRPATREEKISKPGVYEVPEAGREVW